VEWCCKTWDFHGSEDLNWIDVCWLCKWHNGNFIMDIGVVDEFIIKINKLNESNTVFKSVTLNDLNFIFFIIWVAFCCMISRVRCDAVMMGNVLDPIYVRDSLFPCFKFGLFYLLFSSRMHILMSGCFNIHTLQCIGCCKYIGRKSVILSLPF
jgi:hypothetical protein